MAKKGATSANGTVKDLKLGMDRKAIQEAMQKEGQERALKVAESLKENNCRISTIVVYRDGQLANVEHQIVPNYD